MSWMKPYYVLCFFLVLYKYVCTCTHICTLYSPMNCHKLNSHPTSSIQTKKLNKASTQKPHLHSLPVIPRKGTTAFLEYRLALPLSVLYTNGMSWYIHFWVWLLLTNNLWDSLILFQVVVHCSFLLYNVLLLYHYSFYCLRAFG